SSRRSPQRRHQPRISGAYNATSRSHARGSRATARASKFAEVLLALSPPSGTWGSVMIQPRTCGEWAVTASAVGDGGVSVNPDRGERQRQGGESGGAELLRPAGSPPEAARGASRPARPDCFPGSLASARPVIQ